MPKKTTRSQKSRPKPRRSVRARTEFTGHAQRAHQYALDVIAGVIPACKWVVLACRRHVRDLERGRAGELPYAFKPERANRACTFIEALPHTKGKWADRGERLVLQPWQLFIICSLFGWVDEIGRYRFREADVFVTRKNAKSTLAAGIGLYKLCADGEYGAEVYSGATTEKQAWEVFRPAKQMAERTPQLRRAFGLTVNAKSLTILQNGSRFEPVIGKPGDGASPSLAIVDEYHEHASDELVETMRTGMGARDNPLLLKITTAGSNRSSPCYAAMKEGEKILEGALTDERRFVLIYTIDADDDWKSELATRKANPNYDVSVAGDFLADQRRQAIQSARHQNAYLTKHGNVWVNADVAWMNMTRWDACADASLRLEEFARQDCMIGCDLASRVDLASKIRLFRRVIEGKPHYYAFGSHFLNEEAVAQGKGEHYQAWAKDQLFTITPGNVTDYNWIADEILADVKRFHVLEIPHDPYHAAALVQFLVARPDWDQSVQCVEVRQSVQNFSPAMKELEAIVFDGRFHHDGDPVLTWAVANVVCHRDAKENIFPRKERVENKIDPVIALLMALLRWMAQPLLPSDMPVLEIW